MTEQKTYVVYQHVFPDGKRYIGITNDIQRRWNNGFGYQNQRKVFSQIVKFGWDNIKHEVLESGLTFEEAKAQESALIASAVKAKEVLLNTSETVIGFSEKPLSWESMKATPDTIARYAHRFIGDDWVTAYSTSGMHAGIRWCDTYVELRLLPEVKDKKITQRCLRFGYPHIYELFSLTLGELSQWIYSAPRPICDSVRYLGKVPERIIQLAT